MTPRKSPHGKVAKWAYSMYKQQAKKLVHGPFECPSCGRESLVIDVDKSGATGACSCGFKVCVSYNPAFEPIDYYSKILDVARKK